MKKTLIISISSLLLTTACVPRGTSPEAKFYNLKAENVSVVSDKYKHPVGILRVQMPNFADRTQIVSQLKESLEVKVSEFNRWVEPLSILYTRVLAENLNSLLPNAPVKVTTDSSSFDRNVFVNVLKIETILGEKSCLDALYIIKTGDGKVLKQEKFTEEVPINTTYESLVKAQNKLVGDLSRAIAVTLSK